jgi:hypothetical protein
MKRVLILTALAVLALPASAQAVSLHGFNIFDAGGTIRGAITVCAAKQWKYNARVRVEEQDLQEVQTWFYGWTDRTQRICNRITFSNPDDLQYEGFYFARMRVSIPAIGWVRYTGWRRFYTS